jgi:alanyl-tRNA synthetase
MLGNWSLGEYSKQEAIEYSFEFLTKVLKIPLEKIAVSCFEGDKDAPKDTVSSETWKKLGVAPERISFLPKKNNWWGPAGQTGPCGPDTEMFYWRSSEKAPKTFHPEDARWVEIWNDVFMEYEKTTDGKYIKAKQSNVDTGMGVERTLAVLNNLEDNYLTSAFLAIIKEIEKISGKNYKGNEKAMRVIADHMRAGVFILADPIGIKPSNVGHGYVVRRLIRRTIRYWRQLVGQHKASSPITQTMAEKIISVYKKSYPELEENKNHIHEQLIEEENKFSKTLEEGLRAFDKIALSNISGKDAFLLFQSYGFPIEITQELATEKNIKVNLEEYRLDGAGT